MGPGGLGTFSSVGSTLSPALNSVGANEAQVLSTTAAGGPRDYSVISGASARNRRASREPFRPITQGRFSPVSCVEAAPQSCGIGGIHSSIVEFGYGAHGPCSGDQFAAANFVASVASI
jgi:hypothetical protein